VSNLSPTEVGTITINAVLAESLANGTLTNTATISAANASIISASAVLTVENVVSDLAELQLTKSVEPTGAAPGDTITYTLSFSSSGNVPASGVVITDFVPVEVNVQSVVSSGVVLTETSSSPLVWQAANLAFGEAGTITISAVLAEPLAANLVFTNNAIISATNASSAITKSTSVEVKKVAPVLDPIVPKLITRTQTLTFTVHASDRNGDTLTYGLNSPPSGANIITSTGLFSWTPAVTGAYTVTVVVTDIDGLTDSTNALITVIEGSERQIYLPVVVKNN
jgi:uncharacterized repeat protein (TIGR01451 family)